MPNERKTVMISSTIRDLPEHRKEVMDGCLKQGMFPIMMEHLPANDDEAITASLKMVDEADIYVGVYAQRYGYIPKGKKRNPKQISVTEMEYDRAVKRKIPRLVFIMDKTHSITVDDIDIENAAKLKAFKDRVQNKNIINFFKSPADLRSHVINSLSKHLEAGPIQIIKKVVSAIDLDTYYEMLRKRFSVLALEGLTPPQKEEYLQIQLRQVFVEQSVRENPPPIELPKEVWEKLSRDKEIHSDDLPSGITLDDVRQAHESYYEKPSRPVIDVLTDSRYQYTIILGDPGSGKSTLARYVMLSLIDPAGDEKLRREFNSCLPLLIELRSYAGLCADGTCTTFLEFLEYLGKTEGWSLTKAALHNHLKNDGGAVVIFDGLDEIFDPGLREQVTRQITGFCNDYSKARVIVTSRVIGYRRKLLTDAGFTHFTLQDLDGKQVKTFITHWYELAMSERLDDAKERSERILKSFQDSTSIRQLAGNPMLLTIMAIIGKHQELPRERWKLYDHAASVLIQHWDVNKHLKGKSIDAEFIGEDDKKELLRRLAYRMQSGDSGLSGNYIHRDGLQAEFEIYLIERYSQTPDRAKVIATAMIQQFRERNFILSLYGANLYGFVHRAFLEYFCAYAFVYQFEKTRELTIEQLKTEVYDKHWDDQSWHEVLRLICGMVDQKWSGDIIGHLIPKVYSDIKNTEPLSQQSDSSTSIDVSRIVKILVGAIELPAQCLSELKSIIGIDEILTAFSESNSWMARWDFIHTLKEHFHEQLHALSFIRKHAAKDKNSDVRSAAVDALKYYPNEKHTLPFLYECAVNDDHEEVRCAAISALAEAFNDNQETIPFLSELALKDKNAAVRSAALSSIAKNYRDLPETLPLLRERAINDIDRRVRSSALNALAQYFRNEPDTLLLIRERIIKSDDFEVSTNAVSVLARYYTEDPETLQQLQEWSIKSENQFTRSAALSALAENYHDDPQTLHLLSERAVKEDEMYVRYTAVNTIAQDYHKDPTTLPLLRDRAIKDDNATVRSAALNAVAKYYRKNPETLPFLRERAIQDESPKPDDEKQPWQSYVREIAIETLAENWPEHPDTLPLLRERAENDPTRWLRERNKELIANIEAKKK